MNNIDDMILKATDIYRVENWQENRAVANLASKTNERRKSAFYLNPPLQNFLCQFAYACHINANDN